MRKKVIRLLILIILLSNTYFSFAYWAAHVINNNQHNTVLIPIGYWTHGYQLPSGIGPYDPNQTYQAGDLVWHDGYIYRVKYSPSISPGDQTDINGPYYKISLEYQSINTYQAGDIVYYNNSFYEVLNGGWASGTLPGSNGGWKILNQKAWVLGQPYTLGNIVYYQGNLYKNTAYWTDNTIPEVNPNWVKLGDFTWKSNVNYFNNDVVHRNGNYYRAKWNNQNTDPLTSGQYGAWELLSVPNWSNLIAGGTKYTIHFDILFKALVTTETLLRNNEPGTSGSQSVWEPLETEQWIMFKSYQIGDLVVYQDEVYELVNQANAQSIPGSIYNAWNIISTTEYAWFNVYQTGDHVTYNGEFYKVINQINANNNVIPGSIDNAWNNVSSIYWYTYNVYQTGDIVIHQNQVYLAINDSVNQEPGSVIGQNYWELYNN